MTQKHTSLLVLTLALAACAGEQAESTAQAEEAPDTTVKQLERVPLVEADLVNLDLANLSVELPWTRNAINRSPGPAAPRSIIEGVEVTDHEGFDRMTFVFGSDAPAPGYEIRVVPPGVAVVCGEPSESEDGAEAEADVEHAPELAGNQFLVLRMKPARIVDRNRRTMSIGIETYDFARLHEAGIVCEADDVITWIAGLREGSDVRVLEMRSPQRLVVDIR